MGYRTCGVGWTENMVMGDLGVQDNVVECGVVGGEV